MTWTSVPRRARKRASQNHGLYQRLCLLTHGGIPEIGAMLIQDGMEDSRHAISGQIARGLFG